MRPLLTKGEIVEIVLVVEKKRQNVSEMKKKKKKTEVTFQSGSLNRPVEELQMIKLGE